MDFVIAILRHTITFAAFVIEMQSGDWNVEYIHINEEEERVNIAECWWKTEQAGVVLAKVLEKVSFFL